MDTSAELPSAPPRDATATTPSPRLRVAALTHRLPFPPDKGDKIRTFHLLTRLAKRAEVHLLCLADPPEDLQHVPQLRGLFASVTAVPLAMRTQKLRALPYLLTRTPLTLPVFHRSALADAVAELVDRVRPDVFYAESTSMAPYARRHPGVPLVMDFVDVDSAKWRAYAERAPLLARLAYAREAFTLARYEREIAQRAAISTLTAPRELELLEQIAPGARARVLANGVDTDYFAPRATQPGGAALCFFGAMDYEANVDAAEYLVRSVFPHIRARRPDATVALVGARPTARVQALARAPGVTVTGSVPDIRPHVQSAALAVCPLRVARGVQNKVLEAMAMGVPVVASPGAAAGIDAHDDAEFVVAPDDADGASFADAVLALLADAPRAARLVRAARVRVEERYAWQPRADELHELLADAAHRRTPASQR